MTKKTDKPEVIELSEKEILDLMERIKTNMLDESDRTLLVKIVNCMFWIQRKMAHAKITLSKLRRLLGFSDTNKKSQRTAANEEESEPPTTPPGRKNVDQKTTENLGNSINDAGVNADNLKDKKLRRNGRLSANSYTNKQVIYVPHEQYKAGMNCVDNCGGKLYRLNNPGCVIRIKGQCDAVVIHYETEKLRCSLCGELITAKLPEEAGKEKYDKLFKSLCVMKKYYLGVPFYASERYYRALDFPLPDSTQFKLANDVADCAYPVLGALEQLMMHGDLVRYDDTKVKILSHIKKLAENPETKRRGTFTTSVVGCYQGNKIYLYYSSERHAGENMSLLLEKRPTEMPPIITMSDALGSNKLNQFDIIAAHCLAHGVRKFSDIEDYFANECAVVLKALRQVYKNDEKTRELSEAKRLAYHQEHSEPIMNELKRYIEQQLNEKLVEPSSYLGQAINYLLNHWVGLTQFMRVAGAPLDNNICEQALKLVIKVRKMAMFHKTMHGAYVAGLLQSLIATAIHNQVNPVDYLTALQIHKEAVFRDPSLWLPWNYTEQIELLAKAA